MLACLPAAAAPAGQDGPQWAGVWKTNKYGRELRLQQVGEFVYGVAEGCRLAGVADAPTRTLHLSWYLGAGDGSMGVRSGPLRLTMAADGQSFAGDWDGPYTGTLASRAYGQWQGTWETSRGRIWLQGPDGANMWGGYELPDGPRGKLTATIDQNGNVLSGTWQEGGEWGLFELTLGLWGDEFTGWRNTAASPWTGKRL
jgi:hypothetical protein